jgi:hypothetical protein
MNVMFSKRIYGIVAGDTANVEGLAAGKFFSEVENADCARGTS